MTSLSVLKKKAEKANQDYRRFKTESIQRQFKLDLKHFEKKFGPLSEKHWFKIGNQFFSLVPTEDSISCLYIADGFMSHTRSSTFYIHGLMIKKYEPISKEEFTQAFNAITSKFL